jgi:valyl-tRNA synthetase
VQRLVTEIRRFRSDQGLKPNQRVAARLSGLDACGLSGHEEAVRTLVRLDGTGDGFAPTVSFEIGLPTGAVSVELDTSGAIDVAAERARLDKDLAVARKELTGTETKLGNPSFVERAPAEVVDKIKVRRAAAAADIQRIEARLAALPAR